MKYEILLWWAKSKNRELGLIMLYLLTQLICRDGMLGQPLSTHCKTKIESQINTTSIVINIHLEIAEKWLSVRLRV